MDDACWEYRVFKKAPSAPHTLTEESERIWASSLASMRDIGDGKELGDFVLSYGDEARTDIYIRTPDAKSGIKLRGGTNRIEHKILISKEGPFELWEKYGREVSEASDSNSSAVANLARRAGFPVGKYDDVVEVKKYRMQVATFSCKAEATSILVDGEWWRSACVESPDLNTVQRFATWVTGFVGEGLVMGYPEWILKIRSRQEDNKT